MRFHIRDLLWLTLLVAFATAWYVDRCRLVEERRTVEEQRTALVQQVEDMKQLVVKERVVREIARQFEADQELEDRIRAEILDESTKRYLQAVRDPKNGFHYPVIDRPYRP